MDKSAADASSPQDQKNSAGGKSEGGEQSLVGLLKAFTQETSMHGLGRVLSSRYFWLRGLWALCILTGAGVAAYNVVKVILIYSTFPVSTIVTLEYASKVQFPAVTVCNLNMVRKSKWESDVDEGGTTTPASTGGSSATTDDYDSIQELEKMADRIMEIRAYMTAQDKEVRKAYGHQIDRMLLSCVYNGRLCSPENFTQFFSSEYGNCFTFNKKQDAQTVTKPGPRQGLTLELNVEEDEYMALTSTTGFKVMVHPNNVMPFPGEEGFMVSPGFATDIAMSKLDIERTEPPYGRCVNYGDKGHYHLNMYSKEYDVGYSDKACRMTCFQTEVFRRCGCCDREYPCHLTSVTGQSLNTQFCNFSSRVDVDCVNEVLDDFGESKLGCENKCQPSCRETSFSTEVSMARWPSTATESMHLKAFRAHPSSAGKKVDIDYIRYNIVSMNVFFKQLNYEQIQTSPAYDWSRLLSDLGGQFGLWLGFSLLTALEIVQLIFDMCELSARRLFACNNGKTGPSSSAVSISQIG